MKLLFNVLVGYRIILMKGFYVTEMMARVEST